jgi:hypothetical protein
MIFISVVSAEILTSLQETVNKGIGAFVFNTAFFKPASTEVDRFAQILAQSTQESKDEWKQRLSKLEKGWCWSLGPIEKSDGSLIEEAVLVNITSLDERAEG